MTQILQFKKDTLTKKRYSFDTIKNRAIGCVCGQLQAIDAGRELRGIQSVKGGLWTVTDYKRWA
ncbi:MAG: hypothetical protein FD143_3467 [Ignavibacteria bacterium]|nr:MAG: hypothetical protein FD143_3467 [Ignavibacteria bacterium]